MCPANVHQLQAPAIPTPTPITIPSLKPADDRHSTRPPTPQSSTRANLRSIVHDTHLGSRPGIATCSHHTYLFIQQQQEPRQPRSIPRLPPLRSRGLQSNPRALRSLTGPPPCGWRSRRAHEDTQARRQPDERESQTRPFPKVGRRHSTDHRTTPPALSHRTARRSSRPRPSRPPEVIANPDYEPETAPSTGCRAIPRPSDATGTNRTTLPRNPP